MKLGRYLNSFKVNLLCLAISACTNSTPTSSGTKDKSLQNQTNRNEANQAPKNSDACDLTQTGKASDDASKAALQCSYNSLMLAGSLSSGKLAKSFVEIAMGLADIYAAIVDGKELLNDIMKFLDTEGKDPAAAKDTQTNPNSNYVNVDEINKVKSVLNIKFKTFESNLPGPAQTAMYRCISSNFAIFRDFLAVISVANALKDADSFSSVQLAQLVQAPISFSTVITDIVNTNANCTEWIKGSRKESIERAITGMERLQSPLTTITTLADCGVSLAKGGYVLYNNSACLAEDIKKYYDGKSRIAKQQDQTVNEIPVPTFNTESGNRACMAKYGIFLKNQKFYSYVYRSSVCRDYCGNTGPGVAYFEKHVSQIYPRDDDYAWCSVNASKAQSTESIGACIAYCCDQDGECATDAQLKH